MRLKPIAEQVVVVMGASSGMGRLAAQQFAARGARVVVAARTAAALDSLVAEIEAAGGTALAVVADVVEFAQVAAVAARAVERFGRIDSWVHTAGVAVYGRVDEVTPAEFKQVLDVNLLGQVHGAMAALPHLKRGGGGALIHVSSGLGRRAVPLLSSYCASKHGLVGFLDALRVELAHDGLPISVTNILPSSINTPFFSKARTRMGVKPRPIFPVYEPQTAADMILYAAEHPTRNLAVGAGTKLLSAATTVAPRAVDWALARVGLAAQQSDEPRSAEAPSNLFGPLDDGRVRGDYAHLAFRHSLANWLQTKPLVRGGLALALLGAATLAARERD